MRRNSRQRASSTPLLTLTVAAVVSSTPYLMAAVPPPTTQPISWDGEVSNAYVNGTNWNPNLAAPPANANNEFLMINNGGTAVVADGDNAEGAFLNIGLNPGDSGTLLVTGGTLTLGELRVGGRETIANNLAGDWLAGGFSQNGGGTGSVTQSGTSVVNVTYTHGTNPDTGNNYEPPIQSLYVGDAGLASGNTANGSYVIKDSAQLRSGIATNDSIIVGTGAGTHGSFLQQDTSTVTSTGFLTVARRGATGSYTLTGGTLNVGDPGASPGSAMTLFIADGANVDNSDAVAGTIGSFSQSGNSTVNVRGGVEVGRAGGTGTYTMNGGTLAIAQQLVIGGSGSTTPTTSAGLSSTGSFALTGGTITIGTNFNVGLSSSAIDNTANATFTQTGGSISLTADNAIMAVGNGRGTSGTYDISAGSLTSTGTTGFIDIGRNNGNGLFKVSGTADVSVNRVTLNSSNVSANRELRIEGGTMNVAFWEQGSANSSATRTVTQTGGTLNITSSTAAHRAGRSITYNFSGGTTTFAGTIPWDTSIMNVSGTANVTFNNIRTGGAAGGSSTTGTINVTGGSFTAANVNDSNANAAGAVNISGGTVNVPGTWNITNNNPSGAVGSLNITGGNVSINNLVTYANQPGSPVEGTLLSISGGNLNIPSLVLSSNSTLKTDNDITLGSNITLGNATASVNSGSLSLTGSVTTTAARTLTKTGPGTLTISGAQSHVANSAYTVSEGTLVLNSSAGSNLTLNANSTTQFGSDQTLGTLNIAGGVTATVLANGSRTLTLDTLNNSGTLDLTNNSLILNYTGDSPVSNIRGQIQQAFNNGAWDQSGITSTNARLRADNATGLGYVDTGSQIQVKYTWVGDLNLNGKVDADDYTLIDLQVAKFGLNSSGLWANGDVNYDGQVGQPDYTLMDAAFVHQGGTPSAELLASRQAMFGPEYVQQLLASVPEPTSLTLTAISLLGLTRRTRRAR